VDGSGHLLRSFTGTVNLSTSDAAATGLPSTYTFTADDGGLHTFHVTFNTPDTPGSPTTVTATSGAVTGTASVTVTPASTVTGFRIFAQHFATPNTPTAVTVVAVNGAGQVATGYTGTVTLSSTTDPTAKASATAGGTATTLPLSYQFTATDAGVHTFFVTFDATGQQALTVTDPSANLTNTLNLDVFMFGQRHHWWRW
jgi:hypothetical protein